MEDNPYEDSLNEIFSEIDLFINDNPLEKVDISLKAEEFNYISLKLPQIENFDIENLFNYFDEKNSDKIYIVTTIVPYLDSPELKKYYIPHSRLNDFFYYINDPEYEEQVVSIDQAMQE
ncbi:MAG: hypothetical protein AB1782_06785 [Cyanobacteriota bacterium]